jgi:hypothetical protein
MEKNGQELLLKSTKQNIPAIFVLIICQRRNHNEIKGDTVYTMWTAPDQVYNKNFLPVRDHPAGSFYVAKRSI